MFCTYKVGRKAPFIRALVSHPRHCEAPVSVRYVGRYRCEAIQCRGVMIIDN
ncbi:MAG: hypothetical protein LBM98_05075 [Oscillospiraceae bacterium]|nr:hypothetical protein [Oscillospiraceae bacterium]